MSVQVIIDKTIIDKIVVKAPLEDDLILMPENGKVLVAIDADPTSDSYAGCAYLTPDDAFEVGAKMCALAVQLGYTPSAQTPE